MRAECRERAASAAAVTIFGLAEVMHGAQSMENYNIYCYYMYVNSLFIALLQSGCHYCCCLK